MDNVGKRILEVRKHLRLTQNDFAAQFGLSHSHISNIENGRLMPTETLLLFIVEKYNINYDWLKYGHDSMFFSSDILTFTDDEHLRFLNKELLQLYKHNTNIVAGDDLFNIVKGFEIFISITAANELKGENRKKYLSAFYDILDNLKSLALHARHLYIGQRKIHDDTVLSLKLDEDACTEKISKDIKELCNACLQQYGSEIRF